MGNTVFKSDVDDLLSVSKVTVLPFTDNLQGIYSRPLEAFFTEKIEAMHRWDFVKASSTGPVLSPEEFEASPEKLIQSTRGLGVDGAFSGRITKGPGGVNIHLSFFLSKDGKLLSQAILKEYKSFDVNSLNEQLMIMLKELVSRLPYAGRVLSRETNRVTVNLGSRDGLQPNQLVSVVQIVQAQRHPKFNFLIKTEKEILGRVKVLKVDETLSFGVILSEKEKGAIQRGSKVGALDFITYGNNNSLALTPTPEEQLGQRQDSGIAFGKEARAWQPTAPPTFGQVGGLVGLGQFKGNRQSTTLGSLESGNSFAPSVSLLGEIWLTQEWALHARLKQSLVPVKNPASGSSPNELNQSMSYYEAGAGYILRFGPHVWSANVQPYFGFFYYRLFADDSTPRAFTTSRFSGLKVGLKGATPIGTDGVYGVGGDFSMAYQPTVREAPESSGDSTKGSVIQFGVFGYKKIGERIKVQAGLDFEMFAANFSGAGSGNNTATSQSHRFTTLSGGVVFMF
jgi:hypothetical protein